MASTVAAAPCTLAASGEISRKLSARCHLQSGGAQPCGQRLDVSRLTFRQRPSSALTSQKAASFSRQGSLSIKAETRFFDVAQASEAVNTEGYTVVDIRDQRQYEKAHIQGSTHIPLFLENNDTDPATLIKKQVHTSFVGVLYGLAFTKPNEQFLQSFEQKFSKDSKLLVVCQEGLRSGNAVEQLERAGFENVSLLTGGLQKVPPGTFPKEGPKELKDAGKGGFVQIQTQASVVLATILIGAYLYLEFFPDQSTELLRKVTSGGS